jgi:hypothetical protein
MPIGPLVSSKIEQSTIHKTKKDFISIYVSHFLPKDAMNLYLTKKTCVAVDLWEASPVAQLFDIPATRNI